MTNLELKLGRDFYNLEKEYRPLMDELTENQDYYKDFGYKGWVWLQSYLYPETDILFIGYNPGQGKDWKRSFHFPFTGERQPAWFEDNNAYYNELREKETGQPTYWYERNQPEGNFFYKNLLDIIWGCADYLYAEESVRSYKSEVPPWFQTVEKKFAFINLYPIATEDEPTLQKLLDEIYKKDKKKIRDLCNEKCKETLEKKYKGYDRGYGLRFPFVFRVQKFQNMIKPKLTVCLGSQTFKDFTCCGDKINANSDGLLIPKSSDISPDIIPKVIGLDRTWVKPWPIDAAVKEIVSRIPHP